MKVRLAGIVNESVSDGPGLRIALFFQGCGHHCPGCHNPQTWDFSGGDEYEVADLLDSLVDTPLIRGGDPERGRSILSTGGRCPDCQGLSRARQRRLGVYGFCVGRDRQLPKGCRPGADPKL